MRDTGYKGDQIGDTGRQGETGVIYAVKEKLEQHGGKIDTFGISREDKTRLLQQTLQAMPSTVHASHRYGKPMCTGVE